MSEPIRVAVAGHRGKVGSILVPALQNEPGIDYVGGVGKGDDLAAFLHDRRPRAFVDFTRPSEALHNALAAVAAGASPIVGTTGIPPEGVDKIETACKSKGLGGIVAPNFAVGAVLMMRLAEIAAPHFDAVEIIEMHHAAKLDAPSGTALATARRLAARRREKPFSHNQAEKETLPRTRGGEEGHVAVHSVRLPGLVADQEVVFGLPGQTLTIAHRTTSREAYVPGVLLAIREVTSGARFYRAGHLGRAVLSRPGRAAGARRDLRAVVGVPQRLEPGLRRPALHPALVSKADVRRPAHVQRKDVERLGRPPVDDRVLRVAERLLARGVLDRHTVAVELEVTVARLAIALGGRDREPRIAQQIARLARLPHHAEHQVAVDDVGLARADPRPARGGDRSEQAELGLGQQLLEERGHRRRGAGKLFPVQGHF
jgi:4-hydroxy-tetrahydrodipicolinate reductase